MLANQHQGSSCPVSLLLNAVVVGLHCGNSKIFYTGAGDLNMDLLAYIISTFPIESSQSKGRTCHDPIALQEVYQGQMFNMFSQTPANLRPEDLDGVEEAES